MMWYALYHIYIDICYVCLCVCVYTRTIKLESSFNVVADRKWKYSRVQVPQNCNEAQYLCNCTVTFQQCLDVLLANCTVLTLVRPSARAVTIELILTHQRGWEWFGIRDDLTHHHCLETTHNATQS